MKNRPSVEIFSFSAPPPPRDPCNPNPCGANADAAVRGNSCACTCRREYFGDPYSGCRPECTVNSDCIRTLACSRNKCIDPCPGTCGFNAECRVINHNPTCTCLPNYVGDPFRGCSLEREYRMLLFFTSFLGLFSWNGIYEKLFQPSLLLPTHATPTLAAAVRWPGKWVTSAFALVLQIYSGIRTESVSRSAS